jgi:hypothetical protein
VGHRMCSVGCGTREMGRGTRWCVLLLSFSARRGVRLDMEASFSFGLHRVVPW